MLKRLIPALLGLALAQTAAASPELAEVWGTKAGDLHAQSAVLRDANDAHLPQNYVRELERFAITATRLGTWNDEQGGAADLGCIFRGMAEEAELQLMALEDAKGPAARDVAFNRLVSMFDDAQVISKAAVLAARGESAQTPARTADDSIPQPCPANSAVLEALLND